MTCSTPGCDNARDEARLDGACEPCRTCSDCGGPLDRTGRTTCSGCDFAEGEAL